MQNDGRFHFFNTRGFEIALPNLNVRGILGIWAVALAAQIDAGSWSGFTRLRATIHFLDRNQINRDPCHPLEWDYPLNHVIRI